MLLASSFIIEGTSKKGVAIFDTTGTNLQQKLLFLMNKTVYYELYLLAHSRNLKQTGLQGTLTEGEGREY